MSARLCILALFASSVSLAAAPPQLPAGAPSSWWTKVEAAIRDSEYHVTWQDRTALADLDGAWQAPNRAHGFRTYFTPEGIRVVPRRTDAPGWEWALALAHFGRGDLRCTFGPARLVPREERIEYLRGDVTEWYVNSPRGLEQGFDLARPPEEAGCSPESGSGAGDASAVSLDLVLSGDLVPAIAGDGQAIDFRSPEHGVVLHYAALVVTDAGGRRLPARMEGYARAGERGIRILFDDADAVYPVTVDPLATTPAWTVYGGAAGALFGMSLGTAGDVNGDGYSDVIVGAPEFDTGHDHAGRAYVFAGSASGLSIEPYWQTEGLNEDSLLGESVGTAGDVNRDGYSDVIIGEPGRRLGVYNEGQALVYYGSPAVPSALHVLTSTDLSQAERFGYRVSAAGDVDGDGYGDVLVGDSPSFGYTGGNNRAFLFRGSATGIVRPASWVVESDQASDGYGRVATAGDVNGDGYSDILVGAPSYVHDGTANEGAVFAYYGSASGPSTVPNWSAYSHDPVTLFAYGPSTAGDVNGDGYADVIIGDAYAGSSGRAWVYYGSSAGLSTTAGWQVDALEPGTTWFGYAVGTAGDVNGDGYADVIVSDYSATTGDLSFNGAVYVFNGSPTGPSLTPTSILEGDSNLAYIGVAVGPAGDVNGDGFADVIVGAPYYENTAWNEGMASVYLGSPSGLKSSGWSVTGKQSGAGFGFVVAGVGDVNGDGYSDVAVTANKYDAGQSDEGRVLVFHGGAAGLRTTASWSGEGDQASACYGCAVGAAGDVNGDGYGDLVVGVPFYDGATYTNEGRVLLYHGSHSGLATGAAWSRTGGQAGMGYGNAVGTAGDVNGDGYADVVIGADLYDNGVYTDAGRAFVHHGSISGLGASPAWMTDVKQVGAALGHAVATAGDVNRDGYSDVIVGIELYDSDGWIDRGRAVVYNGSATGLGGTPWTVDGQGSNDHRGTAVAGAGDVNGDGYSDVLVGEPGDDYTAMTDRGRVFAYYGSSEGLSTNEDWSLTGTQENEFLGEALASAGDVDGDGYADVVVGARLYDGLATDEGRAWVYHGSAAGLGGTSGWSVTGGQASTYYGASVSSAGDVNGDGYADLLAGAPGYNGTLTDEGIAVLYYGNGGRGLSLTPQQRGYTDARPVAHLGASDSPLGFRLAFVLRTPFGRGRIAVEREVKPLGALLDGRATEVAVEYRDTGPTGTQISLLESDLIDEKPYHWRARFRYDSVTTPFAQRSRWFTIPTGGWQEAHLRTGDPAAAGRVPDTGTPLLVTRAAAGKITLTWANSCMPTDADYAIYEGTAGEYYSHEMRYCSTGGATTRTLTPLSGQTYYLVVPLNGTREGSYGTDSQGHERPVGILTCLPQQVGVCP